MNTETLGMSAEKAICDVFNIYYDEDLVKRSDNALVLELIPIIQDAFNDKNMPKPIKHIGKDKGTRGKQSKSPYDFMLEGNKTLSVKTNLNATSAKVCPPEVGQPGKETFLIYFGHLFEKEFSNDEFKKVVLDKIDKMIPIYFDHLFDCDYLLWIAFDNRKQNYVYNIISKLDNIVWENEYFSFTKNTVESWNESTTVKYKGITIGEFQVHNHRNSYKFRFHFPNLLKLLNQK